jgi:single-strand DNA-binding protein
MILFLNRHTLIYDTKIDSSTILFGIESKGSTTWHNFLNWCNTAEIIEKYLEKGKEIAIERKLISRSYDDKDVTKKYITEIVCNQLLILGAK